MSAAESATSAADAAKTAGQGLTAGLGVTGVADWAEGNGFDRLGGAVAEAARQGGNVLGFVNDLVNRVTPEFISDLIPQGAGEVGEAAGMLVPYVLDVVPVVV